MKIILMRKSKAGLSLILDCFLCSSIKNVLPEHLKNWKGAFIITCVVKIKMSVIL
jgi:hypothetical protein